MRMLVNYVYGVSYIPYRSHNTRSGFLPSSVELEIREVPASALEPAYRVTSTSGHVDWGTAGGQARDIVTMDGKLWVCSGLTADLFRSAHADGYASGPLDPAGLLPSKQHDGSWTKPSRERDLRDRNCGPDRKWNDDAGAAVEAKLRRRAGDIFVSGGMVWTRTYEPCWHKGGYSNREAFVLRTAPPDSSEPFRGHYGSGFESYYRDDFWRVGREADAARAGDTLAAGNAVEVLGGHRPVLADDLRFLIDTCNAVASQLSPHMHVLPVRDCEVLLDLREALAAGGCRAAPGLLDAAEAIAGLGAARIPAWRDGSMQAMSARTSATDICLEAVNRWHARPRDGSEWLSSALPVTVTKAGDLKVREIVDLEVSGALARGLGRDISAMERAAASGGARLLSVSSALSSHYSLTVVAPMAAALVGPGGEVLASAITHGISGERLQALARQHVAAALGLGHGDGGPEPWAEAVAGGYAP